MWSLHLSTVWFKPVTVSDLRGIPQRTLYTCLPPTSLSFLSVTTSSSSGDGSQCSVSLSRGHSLYGLFLPAVVPIDSHQPLSPQNVSLEKYSSLRVSVKQLQHPLTKYVKRFRKAMSRSPGETIPCPAKSNWLLDESWHKKPTCTAAMGRAAAPGARFSSCHDFPFPFSPGSPLPVQY